MPDTATPGRPPPFDVFQTGEETSIWPRAAAEIDYRETLKALGVVLVVIGVASLAAPAVAAFLIEEAPVALFVFVGVVLLFSAPMIGFGAVLISLARRGALLQRHPLVVERGGRLRYGNEELCGSGTVRQLVIWEKSDEGGETYQIAVERDGRGEVVLPDPYFRTLQDQAEARWLANRLGELLGVAVCEKRRPWYWIG